MSYCRWSSDNWRCAVYCYQSDRGYETHVAGNKPVGEIPEEPSWDLLMSGNPAFLERHNAVMDWLKTCERAPIGLPYDGESFCDPDLPSFLATLTMLHDVGYNVPADVIAEVRDEIRDSDTAVSP